LGQVGIAAIDIVLDADRALVVQPDVLFVATERLSIIRNQVWGPPDLVVEVVSQGTVAHDTGEKLAWYRQYGVREYWLVEPADGRVTVLSFDGPAPDIQIARRPDDVVRSTVVEGFTSSASALLP
jgi:Uma2 family endonuclease